MLVSQYDMPTGRTFLTVQDAVQLVDLGRKAEAESSCSCMHQGGMGFLDTMSPWLKYALIGGGALMLLSMLSRPGKAKYNRELADARDEYDTKVRSIRRRYPRLGSRLSGAFAA